jgi:hypothetical protein
MKSPTLESSDGVLREPAAFSLVLGGPLFQLLRRSHLSDDALELMRQRIMSRSWVAATSSPSPIWAIVSKWCGRCKSRRLQEMP